MSRRSSSQTSVKSSPKKLYSLFCPAPPPPKTKTIQNSNKRQEDSDDDDNDDFEITLSSLAQKENRQTNIKNNHNTKTTNRKKRKKSRTKTTQPTRQKNYHPPRATIQQTIPTAESSSTTTNTNTSMNISPPAPRDIMQEKESENHTVPNGNALLVNDHNHKEEDTRKSPHTPKPETTTNSLPVVLPSANHSSCLSSNVAVPPKSIMTSTSPTSPLPPTNIAWQLARRSSCVKTSSLRHKLGSVVPTTATTATATTPRRSGISLDAPPWTVQTHLSFETGYGRPKSTCFAWDEEGVLLAVATDTKHVHIYDWDTVVAKDMSMKRTRTRRKSKQQHPVVEEKPYEDDPDTSQIKPTWTFSTPHEVSFLRWNPYNPDQLAVGFRTTSQLRLYDVSKIAEQEAATAEAPTTTTTRRQHGNNNPKTWITLQPSLSRVPRTQGIRSLLFLPKNHVLVAHKYGPCTLWKIPPQVQHQHQSQQHQPQWYHSTNDEEISNMIPIGSHFVLLGGSLGNIVLLNWRQCTRKAFSSQSSPIIEGQWDTYEDLHKKKKKKSSSPPTTTTTTTTTADETTCVPPARSWMGIRMFLLKPEYKVNRKITTWSKQNIVWVTKCGWILSLKLDMCHRPEQPHSSSSTTRSRVVVLRRSPKMEIRNTQGEIFKHDTYSLPSTAPAVDSVGNCLVWYETPQTTRILPHLDKRVLAENDSMMSSLRAGTTMENSDRDTHKRLSFMDADANKIVKINLLKRNGPPLALALHPSRDWMVVAGGDGTMNLWNRLGLPEEDEEDGSKIPPPQG